jgi:hypothetical protein
VKLWHKSWCAEPIGSHLIPLCFQAPDEPKALPRVSFHELREVAEHYGSGPLFGFTLYCVDRDALPPLEKHPHWSGVWWTAHPVPFAVLEVVERRAGPPPPGLVELIAATLTG